MLGNFQLSYTALLDKIQETEKTNVFLEIKRADKLRSQYGLRKEVPVRIMMVRMGC